MFIRSERLFLRPGWPEDWAELHAIADDERIVRNLARAPWPYGPEDARWFASQPQDPRHPHFFVTLPGAHGTRLIGSVGLAYDDDANEVEIGFWIARSQWGRGYATEAVGALLDVAATLGHRRLVASHFVDNAASGRVLEKAGFVPTGEVRARFGAGRRAVAPTLIYATDLAGAGNGDEQQVMRAA